MKRVGTRLKLEEAPKKNGRFSLPNCPPESMWLRFQLLSATFREFGPKPRGRLPMDVPTQPPRCSNPPSVHGLDPTKYFCVQGPADLLPFMTVPIRSGADVVGTGFWVQTSQGSLPKLITCRHVIEVLFEGGVEELLVPIHVQDEVAPLLHGFIDARIRKEFIEEHPREEVDLVAINLLDPRLLNDFTNSEPGTKPWYFAWTLKMLYSPSRFPFFSVLEPVVMCSYPLGLYDQSVNFPILRTGTTAYHPKLPWKGRSEGLVSIPNFHCDSGAPIFVFNSNPRLEVGQRLVSGTQFFLLGIHHEGYDSHSILGLDKSLPEGQPETLELASYLKAELLRDFFPK